MKRARRTWPALAACVSLYLAALPVQAEEASSIQREYRQRVWTTDDGLPDNWVHSILQSRNGYLWIGTASGLARFDGIKFTAFHHPALANRPAHVFLAEAPDGALWVGTPTGLLRFLDGRFTPYTTQDGLWDDYILALHTGVSGDVWVVTKRGLNRVRQSQLERLEIDDWAANASQNVLSVCEDKFGLLWIVSENGIHQREIATWKPTPIQGQDDKEELGAIFVDPNGTVWLGGKGRLRQFQDGRFVDRARIDLGIGGYVQCFLTDRTGGVWFSTGVSGLGRLLNNRFSRFDTRDGLPDDWIFCGIEDRERNLWFGTASGGLVCWQPRRVTARTAHDGLPNDEIRGIMESRNGSLWIGTDGGLVRLVPGSNKLVLTNYTTDHRLPINTVRAVHEDRKGRVWVGTELGLDCFEGGKFQPISVPRESFERAVRTIHEDRDGSIWFGSKWGLHRWRDGRRKTYTTSDGLSTNEVRVILESRDGDLLVGTLGGGLNRLSFPRREGETPSNPDLQNAFVEGARESKRQGSAGASPAQDELPPRIAGYSTAQGLSNDFVTTLHEETDGTLWIGTRHGLNRLKQGRIDALTNDQGLPDNWINAILDDDMGNYWLSSERGIFHVRQDELHRCADGQTNRVQCVVYDESEGLPTRRTNGGKSQPAAWKCRDGTLWFATPKGVAVIDPKMAIRCEAAPLVVIEQVMANGAVVFDNAGRRGSQGSAGASPSRPPTRDGETLSNPNPSSSSAIRIRATENQGSAEASPSQAPVRLPPGSGNVLEFHYTAPTFVAPERARFRHRLLGFQTNWVEAENRRNAYYTNLRPGDYRLEVSACDHRSIWSETGASLSFYLAPQFHQTAWFRASVVFAVVSSGLGLLRWRTKTQWLEHQNQLAQERVRITRDLHDDLGAGVTYATHLIEQARRKSAQGGNVQDVLGHLERKLQAISQTVGQAVWSAKPNRDTLEDLTLYIGQYAEDFLEAACVRWRLNLPDPLPRVALTAETRHSLFLVVKEALNNIVKHAAATEVRFSVSVAEHEFCLVVEDNGRGFDVGERSGLSSGSGLSNMRHRVESIGGQFDLASRPGQGTRIVARVPIRIPGG